MSVATQRATYRVESTGEQFDNLPPVALIISTGAIHMQDYLTADEADALAERLRGIARMVREREKVAA